MVAVAAGRRSSSGGGAGGGVTARRTAPQVHLQVVQPQQQIVLAAAVVHIASTRSTEPQAGAGAVDDGGGSPEGGGAAGWITLLECVLALLRALGLGSCLGGSAARSSGASAPSYTLNGRILVSLRPGRRTPPRPRPEPQQQPLLEQSDGSSSRIIGNGACSVASLYTQQGKKGVNQDSMIVCQNFASRDDAVFCGVFDGHGKYGHLVSRRVRDVLPGRLGLHIASILSFAGNASKESFVGNAGFSDVEEFASSLTDVETSAQNGFYQNGMPPDNFVPIKESFYNAFDYMDADLKKLRNIDCYFSGSTAVTIIKLGPDLLIGNLGDSRAVLGTRNENGDLTAVQLTLDLKPSVPREAERILRCDGRIFPLRAEPHVLRVWQPKYDLPGLAMARSFGDFCLKEYGLISVPEVSYHRVTERDEFVVMATDGVWDVLSNEEVVEIVSRAPFRSSAARFLVEAAVRAWRTRYPASKADDCAVVCLFLHPEAGEPASTGVYRPGAIVNENETDSWHGPTVRSSFMLSGSSASGTTADADGTQLPVTLPNLPTRGAHAAAATKRAITKK